MGFYDLVLGLNAVILEYNNNEGSIPEDLKNRFQMTYIGLCFTTLTTISI